MPRKCSLCIHEKREEIERALLGGGSYRTVAQRFGVSRDAVVRHRRHLPAALAHAREVKEVAHGDSLVAQLRELTSEAQRLKEKAERGGDLRTALAAIRELCRVLELLAKLRGELISERQTTNVLNLNLDAETAERIARTYLLRHRTTSQPPELP